MRKRFPQTPPRLTWLFAQASPFYFVTFNTQARLPLLANDDVHETFLEFCTAAQERHIAVGRYVLMPDHVHLFVMLPKEGPTLSQWVQMLKTVVGKRLVTLGKDKPHWQEGFFDHLLRSSESYGVKWEYVRQNPVRAGLCENPSEWPYQGEILPIEFR